MQEISKLLDTNEKIMWEGKPQFAPFVLGTLGAVLFGLIFVIASLAFMIPGMKSGNYFTLLIPHFWIGVSFILGGPFYAIFVYRHVHYVITNKRVILQKGLIGRDFEMADFDQITNSTVNVGLLDKLAGYNSGSIAISTAGTFVSTKNGMRSRPYTLQHITDPYEVFKLLKQVSHDVKTDIEYPNDLRPKVNPGYQTEYKAPESP